MTEEDAEGRLLKKVTQPKTATGTGSGIWRAAIGALPIIKKGLASHCIICNTFEKASFMPEFQRSASGL